MLIVLIIISSDTGTGLNNLFTFLVACATRKLMREN